MGLRKIVRHGRRSGIERSQRRATNVSSGTAMALIIAPELRRRWGTRRTEAKLRVGTPIESADILRRVEGSR